MPVNPPGRGTGFISASDYLDANQGTIANEQKALTGDVQGQYDLAKGAADSVIAKAGQEYPDDYTSTEGYGDALQKINQAQQGAGELSSQGGLADLLKQHYGAGNPTYTVGGANFDASLLGVPGAQAYQTQAGGLGDYLNSNAAKAAIRPPPPPPPPPPVAPPPVEDPGPQEDPGPEDRHYGPGGAPLHPPVGPRPRRQPSTPGTTPAPTYGGGGIISDPDPSKVKQKR